MSQSLEAHEFRDATLSQVKAAVDTLLDVSADDEAADVLLSFGLSLVDQGLAFALDPVFTAVDGLKSGSHLRKVDDGWYAMLRGLGEFRHGRLDVADGCFDEAIRIGSDLPDQGLISNGLQNRGLVAWLTGDLQQAERDFVASNERRPKADDEGYAKVLVNLASLYLDLGAAESFGRTVARLASSPAMAKRGADRSALLGLQGLLAVQEGRLQDAERLLRSGCVLARRRGIVDHEIVNLQNLGSVLVDLERPGRALRPLRRAAKLARLTEDHRQLELAERTLATALVRAGRFKDAIATLLEANADATDQGDETSVARIAADLGALYLHWKKPADAVATLERALETFVRTRQQSWGHKTVLNLGLALARTGAIGNALEVVRDKAHEVFEEPSDVGDLLETFGDLIWAEYPARDCALVYRSAIEEYERQQTPGLADKLAEIASKLADSGTPEEAVAFFDNALRRYDPADCHIAPYQILNDRGLAKAAGGDLGAAIVDLKQSLILASDSQDRAMRALCLNNLSEMTRRLGETNEAVILALEAVATARDLKSQTQIGSALATLGLAQLSTDDPAEAAASFRESLRLARRTRDRSTEAIALGGLGQVAFSNERYRTAIRHYLRAVEIESSEADTTHETETWAALTETAACLEDRDRFESYLQRLIEAVQKEKGPLVVALGAMQRAGTTWFEAGDLEAAGGVFATAILLAAVESAGAGAEEFATAIGRAVLIPFFAAASAHRESTDLERYVRAELRRHLGRSARMIEDLFPMAREAIAERVSG
jgi:tetratricopeptide (TPR) repeat protein